MKSSTASHLLKLISHLYISAYMCCILLRESQAHLIEDEGSFLKRISLTATPEILQSKQLFLFLIWTIKNGHIIEKRVQFCSYNGLMF